MAINIDELTEEELVDLNHRVVERLRFLAQMRAHGAMLNFSIGQRVSFETHDGRFVTGTLTKYNKKTVSIITDDGHRWNVSPGFLRPAEPKDITPNKSHVVPPKSPS